MTTTVEIPKSIRREARASSYAQIAPEYYNAERHPTCANFRAASALFVRRALRQLEMGRNVVDVGAGCSLAAELLIEMNRSMANLVLLDGSIEMLAHSVQFMGFGARGIVGDARRLPFGSATTSLVIVSLGDPFNTEMFWNETARCLRPGGACVFTTPSYEWACSFRRSSRHEREGYALFELINGQSVYVPSIVHSPPQQAGIIERSGLAVTETMTISGALVPPPYSKKLSPELGIVTGYIAIRR
jgi:SAM-dependent methyltransferase